jgi:hypothetical protein
MLFGSNIGRIYTHIVHIDRYVSLAIPRKHVICSDTQVIGLEIHTEECVCPHQNRSSYTTSIHSDCAISFQTLTNYLAGPRFVTSSICAVASILVASAVIRSRDYELMRQKRNLSLESKGFPNYQSHKVTSCDWIQHLTSSNRTLNTLKDTIRNKQNRKESNRQ